MILFASVFIGCNDNRCYTKLEEIDSLTENDLTDSAFKVIDMVEKTYKIKEGKEQAYYNLLKYQLVFRNQYNNGNKFMDDNIIDYSISYYSKYMDAHKLALCYYLKGRVKEYMNKNKEAIRCLKKAELIAEETDDSFLKMRICSYIAVINGSNEDYNSALKYGLKAVEYGKNVNDTEVLVACLSDLSGIYGNLGKSDSSLYYATKCLDYLKGATPRQKAYIYLNVAATVEKIDTIKAREYAWKSIEITPTNNAYQILAKMARDRKDYKQSEIYLNEALKYSKSVDWEAFIVYELAQTKELMGQHEEANRLSKRVIMLRDSVEKIKAQDSIREIQIAYEVENKSNEEIEEKENRTILIAVLLTLVIVITVVVFGVKRHKMRKSMERQQEEHKHEMRKIEERNNESKKENREIKETNKKMQRQMEQMRQKAARQQMEDNDSYHDGFNIYNKVKDGNGTVNWDKTNIRNFMMFYQSISPDFKKNTDSKYTKLTDYQYVLLAMKDMGMNNKQIATALGISESAVRTQTSRIKKATTEGL